MKIIETILNLNEKSIKNSYSRTKKEIEQETNAKGLILKELPSHLKYAFLELEKTKPVIISTALTYNEDHKLLKLLRKYKEAISWSIEDLKGISPFIFHAQNFARR